MLRVLTTVRRHRNVLGNFIARDLKVKYRGTVFGYLWSLLEPLSLVLIYYFVFEVVVNRNIPHYPLIVILGVLPYNFMSGVVNAGAASLVSNAPLVRRVALPREVYVLAAVGSQLIVFFLSMLVVIPFFVIYDVPLNARMPLFLVAAVLMTLFATGIALVAACANVIFRDVGYVLRVVLRLFFYGSPVIYSVSIVAENPTLLEYYLWNPVAVYLSLARTSLLGDPFIVPMPQLASAVVVAFATATIGALAFRHWEKRAVKFL